MTKALQVLQGLFFRSYLKNVFWPSFCVGPLLQRLGVLQYASQGHVLWAPAGYRGCQKNVPIEDRFSATNPYTAIIFSEHYYDKRYKARDRLELTKILRFLRETKIHFLRWFLA